MIAIRKLHFFMVFTKRVIHFLYIVIALFVTSVWFYNILFIYNFYSLWCLLFYPIVHSFLIINNKHITILLEKCWLHFRYGQVSHTLTTVSYTHLDVYKRQVLYSEIKSHIYYNNTYHKFDII